MGIVIESSPIRKTDVSEPRLRTPDKTGTGYRTTPKNLTELAEKGACPGFVRAFKSSMLQFWNQEF